MTDFLLNHLLSRHLDVNLHKVWIDEKRMKVTFPLYNLCGQMIGYQQYYPLGSKDFNNDPREGKYFTRSPSGAALWGMESWSLSYPLFLTEGLFDAARMTSRGCSALACFTNNPKHIQNWLWTISQFRPIIALCDRDDSGIKLAKYGTESYIIQSAKDLGDADESEVDHIVEKYS